MVRKFTPRRRFDAEPFDEELRQKNRLREIEQSISDIEADVIVQADITDVTATAGEVNLLDLAGLGDNDVLSADTASTASWKKPVRNVDTLITTSLTINLEDVVLVDDDTAGGAVTITLPTAVGKTGREIDIKKLGTTAAVTIDADGTETIDGSLTIVIAIQYESVTLISDGANWSIL